MAENDGKMGLFLASLAKGRGTAAAVGGLEPDAAKEILLTQQYKNTT